jgi:hypothetical protein
MLITNDIILMHLLTQKKNKLISVDLIVCSLILQRSQHIFKNVSLRFDTHVCESRTLLYVGLQWRHVTCLRYHGSYLEIHKFVKTMV